MTSVKELAKWLKEEVEFLKANQDYVGGWFELGNGLGATVLWEQGWGDEKRDDIIQADDNPDWGLCAGVMVINYDDTPDGWFMPWDSETGDIICETTGIIPDEDYEQLAKWLLEDFDRVKDCDIAKNGETKCVKEPEVEPEVEAPVEEESLKEEHDSNPLNAIGYWANEVKFQLDEYYHDKISDKSTEDINDMAERIANKILNDDYIWENVNESIDWYIEEELGLNEGKSKKPCKESKETKPLKESKEFNTSPYHDTIAEYFDYDSDFEFLDVVASILGRVDDFEDDEDIYQAIDDELIYYYDQWRVLEHYCTPQDANWEVAFESLVSDVFSICSQINGEQHEESDVEEIKDGE